MQVVSDLKGKTIAKLVKGCIEDDAPMQTDAYHSYRKPLAEKYPHVYQVFDSGSDILTLLHTIIGNAKAFASDIISRAGKKHLQSYLDEFCYRFNCRYLGGDIFSRLLFIVM